MLLQQTDFFLLNDFYSLTSIEKAGEQAIITTISLNTQHPIFKGHFEQMPIVPGVCQTQLIKEVLQKEINEALTLTKGSNIKFTGMIIPDKHPIFSLELSYKKDGINYIVDAKLFSGDSIFTKFKGIFTQLI